MMTINVQESIWQVESEIEKPLQAVLYSIWTLVISVFPVLGLTGDLRFSSAAVWLLSGLWLIISAMRLFKNSIRNRQDN